jgi:large-conductance mechanosensitive channel
MNSEVIESTFRWGDFFFTVLSIAIIVLIVFAAVKLIRLFKENRRKINEINRKMDQVIDYHKEKKH